MALTQEQLMRLMGGVDLPTSDYVYGGGQDQAQDPRQQLIDMLGGAGLGGAIQQGVGLADMLGVNQQKDQYRFDDRWKIIGDLLDLQTQGAKAGIQAQQDEQSLGMKQQQLSMDQQQFAQDYGDPQAQIRFLMSKGLPPQSIVDAFEAPTDANDFEKQMKAIDDALNEQDKYGQQVTVHSQGGMANRHRLYETAKQMASQAQAEESQALTGKRWKGLDPEMRAKEIYLRQQNPTKNLAVNKSGDVFYGDDAEQKALGGENPTGLKAAVAAGDKGKSSGSSRGGHSLRSDVAANKTAFRNAALYVSPAARVGMLATKAPGAAKAAWKYVTG